MLEGNSNSGATKVFGHWVSTTSNQWQPNDLAAAYQLTLDTIACIAAGAALPETAVVLAPYSGRGVDIHANLIHPFHLKLTRLF